MLYYCIVALCDIFRPVFFTTCSFSLSFSLSLFLSSYSARRARIGYIAREKEVARSLYNYIYRENVKATRPPRRLKRISVRRWSASDKFQWRYWFCDCCCWLEGEVLDCCWAGCCCCCCCCCCCGCCCVDAAPCWDVVLPSLREREPASWLLPRPAREPVTPAPGAPDDCRTIARILLCADCANQTGSEQIGYVFHSQL